MITALAVASWTSACAPNAAEEADRARHLARTGDLSGAAMAWSRALEQEDSDPARLELARTLVQLARPEDAAREYQLLLRHRPDYAALWLEFGRFSESSRHDLRGAELAYRRAAELAPDNAEAHLHWGLVLVQLSDFEGAKAELQAALSLGAPDAPWRETAQNAIVEAHLRQREAERRQAEGR
ncbi:MAG: hypothetical protein IPJ77_22320 [Planctomycetes bacterium]|nr:hypothetical protein [Planctomycetota bacterium]